MENNSLSVSKFANQQSQRSLISAGAISQSVILGEPPTISHQPEVMVEKYFSFFQIETKLRDIVVQMQEETKKQIYRDQVKQGVLAMKLDQLEAKIAAQKADIQKQDHKWKQFEVVFDQLQKINEYVDEKNRETQQKLMEFETLMARESEGARHSNNDLKNEFRVVYDLKKDLVKYSNKIEEYKAEMNKRLNQEVHLFSLEVAEIRKPQAYMQALLEQNNLHLQQYSDKGLLRQVELNVLTEKTTKLQEQINYLADTKLASPPFWELDSFARSSIKALEKHQRELEEIQQKTIDFQMRFTPKIARNYVNEVMNKALRPLQLKDVFSINVKPSQLVDNPDILEKEKLDGKDGKPYYIFKPELTDEEEVDPAIETSSVRNWRAIHWDTAKLRVRQKWCKIMEEQQQLTKQIEIQSALTPAAKTGLAPRAFSKLQQPGLIRKSSKSKVKKEKPAKPDKSERSKTQAVSGSKTIASSKPDTAQRSRSASMSSSGKKIVKEAKTADENLHREIAPTFEQAKVADDQVMAQIISNKEERRKSKKDNKEKKKCKDRKRDGEEYRAKEEQPVEGGAKMPKQRTIVDESDYDKVKRKRQRLGGTKQHKEQISDDEEVEEEDRQSKDKHSKDRDSKKRHEKRKYSSSSSSSASSQSSSESRDRKKTKQKTHSGKHGKSKILKEESSIENTSDVIKERNQTVPKNGLGVRAGYTIDRLAHKIIEAYALVDQIEKHKKHTAALDKIPQIIAGSNVLEQPFKLIEKLEQQKSLKAEKRQQAKQNEPTKIGLNPCLQSRFCKYASIFCTCSHKEKCSSEYQQDKHDAFKGKNQKWRAAVRETKSNEQSDLVTPTTSFFTRRDEKSENDAKKKKNSGKQRDIGDIANDNSPLEGTRQLAKNKEKVKSRRTSPEPVSGSDEEPDQMQKVWSDRSVTTNQNQDPDKGSNSGADRVEVNNKQKTYVLSKFSSKASKLAEESTFEKLEGGQVDRDPSSGKKQEVPPSNRTTSQRKVDSQQDRAAASNTESSESVRTQVQKQPTEKAMKQTSRPDKQQSVSSESSDESETDSESDDSNGDESEGFQQDPYELEEEAAVSAQLGFDLGRFLKRDEFDFNIDKIFKKLSEMQDRLRENEIKIQVEIQEKGYEYTKGITVIEAKIKEAMNPALDELQMLLREKARNRADDMLLKRQLNDRMDIIVKEQTDINEVVQQTLCPLVTCLFENQNIQMRAEEQDEIDRNKIALYGQTEQAQAEDQAKTRDRKKSPDLCSRNHTTGSPTSISKSKMFIPSLELDTEFGPRDLDIRSQQVTERVSYLRSREEEFGSEPENDAARWMEQSTQLSVKAKGNWAQKQPCKEVVQLDQTCLNCSENQQHVSKLFKVACLAYRPNNVLYRKKDFTRDQLLVIRKFLVGKASQIMLQSKVMQNLGLTTKNLFDDVYLHIRKQADGNKNISQEAQAQWLTIERVNSKTAIRSALMISENIVQPQFRNTQIDFGSRAKQEIEVSINKQPVATQGSNLSYTRGLTPLNNDQQQRLGATFWQTRRGQSVDTHQKLEAIKRPVTDNKTQVIRVNEPFLKPVNFVAELPNERMEFEPKLQALVNQVEPITKTTIHDKVGTEFCRMAINQNAKRAFKGAGCEKEKERQYKSYVIDTKANETIRRPINIGMAKVGGKPFLTMQNNTPRTANLSEIRNLALTGRNINQKNADF